MEKKIYNLTSAQNSIWLTEQYSSNTSLNNIGGYVFIQDVVNFDNLEKALKLYVKRNDALDFKIQNVDGEPCQYLSEYKDFSIDIVDLKDLNDVKSFNDNIINTPFTFLDSTLYKITMFRLPDGKGGFNATLHHIISDAWNMSLLIDEVMNCYSALCSGKEIDLMPFPSYIDCIESENTYNQSERFKKDEEFWKSIFKDTPELTYISPEKHENASSVANRKIFDIDSNLYCKISEFCKFYNCSIYTFFMAIYSIYLAKVNNSHSSIIGTPVLNRGNYKEKHTAGMFISTVPFKIDANPDVPFTSFLKDVASTQLGIFRHQKYPYDKLLKQIKKEYNISDNLYDFVLSYQNAKDDKNSCDVNYISNWLFNGHSLDTLQVHFYDMDDNGTPKLYYDYQIDKLNETEIISLNNRIMNMAKNILETPDILLKNISIVTNEESMKLLHNFNSTPYEFDTTKSLVKIFEEQVDINPDKTAIIFEDKILSYSELNKKINALSNILIENNVGKNNVIGIMLPRSFETIISMWAVLKSGNAYILIDPSLPKDRIEYMLENANSNLLITNSTFDINCTNKLLLDLSIFLHGTVKENISPSNANINNPEIYNDNNDPFCVIYTSGSTGTPKGVELKRVGIINMLYSYKQFLYTDTCDVFLSTSTVAFDMFIVENYVSLLSGKTVLLANEDQQKVPVFMSELISKYKSDFILSTPSKISLLLLNESTKSCLKDVKIIQLGGEVFKENLYNELHSSSNAKIFNGYGPSECTACCSNKEISLGNQISIGKPFLNTNIYILNSDLNLMPIGYSGEICVAGLGVGNGYINNPELTNKSFITNPFDKNVIYKTGDIGKYSADGELHYQGRRDAQVKLRGLRIELDEITNKIISIDGIKNAVTVIKKVNNINCICSYVINSNKSLTEKNIKELLSDKLPQYMIPSHIVFLEKLPITLNGKVDTKKLPEVSISEIKYIAPSTQTEITLEKLWSKILDINNISINANFFDLGGDSLCSIKLISEIYSALNVKVSIKDIFNNPTIESLAKFIDTKNINKTETFKITKAEKSDSYPLSSAQKRIFYACQLDTESVNYNTPGGLVFSKLPDINKLEKCFNILINRHSALRTYFSFDNDNVVQKVLDHVDFKLNVIHSENQSTEDVFAEFVKPFSLDTAPLFRANMHIFSDNKYILFIDMHHIICDGESVSIFINELCKLYNGEELEKNELDYIDYSVWENNNTNSKQYIESENYWLKQFDGEIPLLNMPTTYTRPSIQSFEGANYHTKLSKDIFKKIENTSKHLGITPYMLMLSAFYVLLSKYSSQNDIVVGTPIVGREIPELTGMLGMFVNTLALRSNVEHESSFREFSYLIKSHCLSAFQNQTYPFDELVSKLNIKRDTSRNPLFDVMFIYQNNGYPQMYFNDIDTKYYIPDNNISKFDLSMEIIPINAEYMLRYEYCTNLFNEEFIKKFSVHYEQILNIILENIDIKISDIDMLSTDERNQILYDFNNTSMDYPYTKNIVDLFEEQVRKTPDSIAVVSDNQSLTYQELNEKANQLAHLLISKGINIGDVVGVYLTRCPELLVSIFGILKSGAVYMPMYTGYPVDRLKYMLENSSAKYMITTEKMATNIDTDVPKILADGSFINLNIYDLPTSLSSDNLAYIIYTSGSTGRPKGVKITHRNLINFVYAFSKYYNGITTKDTFLASTNISFDVSIWEIFLPLLNGAKLVLNTEEIISNISLYCENILRNKITALYIPPNILNEVYTLLSKNSKVYINKLLVGVEPIKNGTLNQYYDLNPNMIIVNGYGPTEATICSTALVYSKNADINSFVSIGRPLYNNKIYIMDSDNNLCPIGVNGEIYIAGDGVGKGYLNNEIETSKSFIHSYISNDLSLLYKTGDLAKWNEDGTISFSGRLDNQVKLSGYRIELSEINNCINQYSGIGSVYTTIMKNNNKDCIVSYITSKYTVDIENLVTFLRSKLPFYMIPTFLIQIDNFPLTPNGKIDKHKLPLPNFESTTDYIEPNTDTEKALFDILTSLLGIDKISITDNLFDYGMDSLLAIKLAVRILDELHVSITVKDVFQQPRIKELALYISSLANVNRNSISAINKRNYYPLSSAQKRIYYSSNMNKNSVLYNISGGIVIDHNLDINRLQESFQTLVNRHEVLRTHFDVVDNDVFQFIDDNVTFSLITETSKSDDLDSLYSTFLKPFDLSKAPLFRAKVIYLPSGKKFLLIDMHHIISDGTSLNILLKELCSLYNNQSLYESNIDYKDFTIWEQQLFETDNFQKSKDFWVKQYKDEIPLLNMPSTFSRPSVKSFDGTSYYTKLPNDIFEKIHTISNSLGITPYMLFLSAYYILLSKYSSQDDIVIGTPIVNRELPELSNMVGMFVNTLALRNTVNHSYSFREFTNKLKEYCLSAFQNQIYPFDELIKDINFKRDNSRNPLFDIMFIYQNAGYPEIDFNGCKAEYYIPNSNVSKFDLSLEVVPMNEEYLLRYEYCTKLFDEAFIQRLSAHYIQILTSVLENVDIKISNIDMLSKKEREQILYGFNDTKMDYPHGKTIVDLFEEQVQRTPNSIAVVFENQSLTYQELNEKSNQLARYLINRGISNNSIVGIMLPRCLEIMIAFLGVLKAGACYIPIDPSFPKERIKYMLENSNASILLKLHSIDNVCFDSVANIDFHNSDVYNYEKDNLHLTISPDSRSYIIYTSGSTGKPKGVVLKHKSLMNLTCYLNTVVDYFKNNQESISIVSITTISFDIFLFETIISLQKGLTVIIANETQQTNPIQLDELISRYNVKAIQMTPSRMEVFLNNKNYMPHLSNLKYITLAGEALSDELKNKILDLGNIIIYNGYGPSETTVFSTFTDVTTYSNVTIGKPLSNTYAYVLDKDQHLCPVGIPGELYISGEGVGYGYLNQPELTSLSFIPDIYHPELTMYKTGDLVKFLPNGELDYIGRLDNQVKIRGLRIELDEIQKWITQYKDINKVVLSASIGKNKRQYLVAYLTIKNRISINDLKVFLGKHIPKYMIPTYFIIMNEFPYLPNGKIDKKSLPLPNDEAISDKKYIAPTTQLEIDITKIFENLLSVSPISIEDNFFEIGGDSLLAMTLQLELLKLHINISYSDIFMYPSIKELSEYISSSAKKSLSRMEINDFEKFDTILESTTQLPLNLEYAPIGNILLTGVTGFLGIHILNSFLESEKGIVYCLIRSEPGLTIYQKLQNKLYYYFDHKYDNLIGERIIPIESDICMPNLGLSDTDLQTLIDNVNIVVNSAAKVSHYGNYNDYKKVNVDGTENLTEFCLKHNKKFYQISTLSVSGNSLIDDSATKQNFQKDVDFCENNFYINQILDNVYVRSKFEAEKVVLEHILSGLDGYIIRVGNLMNRFSDGKFQPNVSENAYINRLLAFYKIGCIPDYLLNGYLELTPVDYCADAITKILQYNCKLNRIFHLLNHKNVDVKFFIDTLNHYYDKINIVDNATFIQNIDNILNNSNTNDILSGLINDFDDNKHIVYSSPVKIKSNFTVEYLHKIGFEWPNLEENYILKFLKYYKNLNLLNRKDGD